MKNYFYEFLGTFFMVFMGTGAIIITGGLNEIISNLIISLSFGGSVFISIWFLGKASGSHINPAVTISLRAIGKVENNVVIPYIISQIIGGISASIILSYLFPCHLTLGVTIPSTTLLNLFIIEFLISFLLMVVIINAEYKYSALLVGLTVFAFAFIAGPITGASMNPARSIGPAIISNNLDYIFVYIFSSILGMVSSSTLLKSKDVL